MFPNYGTVEEGVGRFSYLPVWKSLPCCFYYNQLLHNYTSQYDDHSYMFRHFCVVFMEFQKLYFAKLLKLLKLKWLKLLIHKVIRLKYYLFTSLSDTVYATLQYLVEAVCLCGCIYHPLLLLHVCWSGMYISWL